MLLLWVLPLVKKEVHQALVAVVLMWILAGMEATDEWRSRILTKFL
jgi:hypothetical protein